VVFHARLGEEAGLFTFNDVISAIAEKMIRRHPHVFAGAAISSWEDHKTAERAARKQSGILADIPIGLPALTRAAKLSARAARVGFDWPDIDHVFEKLAEETAELRAELFAANPAKLADELGDMLFVMVNLARKLGLDPEACLRGANDKFFSRFSGVEARLAAEGKTPSDATLAEMEAHWLEVKAAANVP
jgi:ATP diphosphatase